MSNTKNSLRQTLFTEIILPILALIFTLSTPLCLAQSQQAIATPAAQGLLARAAANDGTTNSSAASAHPAASPDPEISPAVARELAALRAEIEELKAEIRNRNTAEATSSPTTPAPAATPAPATTAAAPAPAASPAAASSPVMISASPAANSAPTPAITSVVNAVQTDAASSTPPAKKQKIDPFSDWDWTWLNGAPRNKDVAFDTKFFTPEIRADVTYNYDFNKPVDNSIGGSSEMFRANELQLEQLGVGGDFHLDNVRARLMTQYGMYSATTPRNDPSPAKGQWDLDTAYRYISEAYGGYHINALNGINIDAGIFMSYIGLFSYYNYDNWAYQPSYVSSNTPWFFNGLRIQIFPTAHLKIEPWIINGWQSYGSANSRKGLGGQIKYTPFPWMNIISNNYGLGHDDLYVPNRGRIHTDDSVEVKYYDHPERMFDKMAFTFTGDMGCEFGPSQTTSTGLYEQGVGCHGNTHDKNSVGGDYFNAGIDPKQSFIGFMLYDRTWFKKDKYAFTIGGGKINNPGRYLVLLPPINGETAPSAAINSPYFTENPSDPFKAWDMTFTYDYMPRQWITFRSEFGYRHANVPYWTGHGGITPPGSGGVPYTNNGYPQYYACNDGNTSGSLTLSGAQTACGAQGSSVWFPDLRKDESFVDFDILVKF
jgi:hypothetical protein